MAEPSASERIPIRRLSTSTTGKRVTSSGTTLSTVTTTKDNPQDHIVQEGRSRSELLGWDDKWLQSVLFPGGGIWEGRGYGEYSD